MFDWLAKVGKKALEAGAGYFEYQKFLLHLSQLPPDAARAELRDRVGAMTDAGFAGFMLMVNSMLQQELQRIQQLNHAGRFGATPLQLQALQSAQSRAQWLAAVVQHAGLFRSQRPEQAMPSPAAQGLLDSIRRPGAVEEMLARAETSGEPPAVARQGGVPEDARARLMAAMQEGEGMPAMLRIVREEFQQQVQSGKIAPERRAHYESVLDRLHSLVTRDDDDLASKMAILVECQQMMREWSAATVAPSQMRDVRQAAGTRAERVHELVKVLGSHVMHACSGAQHMSGLEGERAMDLYTRWMKARNAAAEPASDARTRELERETFRRVASDFLSFSLRTHFMLARPIWKWDALAVDPNRVFFSGPSAAIASKACASIGADLAAPGVAQDAGQSRWDQLRSSSVAVFDLTGYAPDLWRRDLDAAGRAAQVGYELGVAFVLGKPVVIVAGATQSVPFDVDIEPTRIDPADEDESSKRIADAVDAAMYTPQRGESESSIKRSVEFVRARAARAGNNLVGTILKQADEHKLKDPVFTANFLAACVSADQDGPMAVLFPAWPGAYPDDDHPRCFHVTGFRDWTAFTSAAVQAACTQHAVEYVRGDEAVESDIIRSIWDELCRATHVVCDLSEANINAALELGVAHAMGKPTFIMTQAQQKTKFFPSISKLRMFRYSIESPDQLTAKVGEFLSA